ncbi:FAD-dependent oxidoreductase [Fastidiosibacter lacustris]|uniref:FAD-dependent oxidoreductase n=1 Tax=Fastidiosibacter lacustris TaxID=2056695 RepID=UPI000E342606|nr:FAD-dependent oxidoreductase [Fastidiosibacter lacustris]
MQYDVIVIGGGMAGLACALGLSHKGFSVVVLDAKKIACQIYLAQQPKRVSAINHASEEFLTQLGVWQEIIQTRAQPYVAMQVWDQHSSAQLNLQAHAFSQPNLGMIVENDLILSTLRSALLKTNVEIFEEIRIKEISKATSQGQNNILLENGKTLQCKLIIGADGANSFVRDYFQFQYKKTSYEHHAIVANIKTQKSHQSTAYQRFLSNGVLAFLPLSDPYLCSIVYSIQSNKLNDILTLSEIEFSKHLFVASEAKLGQIELKSPRMSFELIERHVDCYYQKAIVVIADAAHTIHPLAGQGINLGFADANVLIEVLAHAKAIHRDIADVSTLAKYERKRRVKNQTMLHTVQGLKQLFCNDNRLLKPLRALGMNFVNDTYLLKRFFIEKAAGH